MSYSVICVSFPLLDSGCLQNGGAISLLAPTVATLRSHASALYARPHQLHDAVTKEAYAPESPVGVPHAVVPTLAKTAWGRYIRCLTAAAITKLLAGPQDPEQAVEAPEAGGTPKIDAPGTPKPRVP